MGTFVGPYTRNPVSCYNAQLTTNNVTLVSHFLPSHTRRTHSLLQPLHAASPRPHTLHSIRCCSGGGASHSHHAPAALHLRSLNALNAAAGEASMSPHFPAGTTLTGTPSPNQTMQLAHTVPLSPPGPPRARQARGLCGRGQRGGPLITAAPLSSTRSWPASARSRDQDNQLRCARRR